MRALFMRVGDGLGALALSFYGVILGARLAVGKHILNLPENRSEILAQD